MKCRRGGEIVVELLLLLLVKVIVYLSSVVVVVVAGSGVVDGVRWCWYCCYDDLTLSLLKSDLL